MDTDSQPYSTCKLHEIPDSHPGTVRHRAVSFKDLTRRGCAHKPGVLIQGCKRETRVFQLRLYPSQFIVFLGADRDAY
jgi:hypothetical protein